MDVRRASPLGRPRRQRRAFSTVGGAVDVAGDEEEARALARLWDVDPGLARSLTHGFHSYAGRMHPAIARGAIIRFSNPGDLVVDPFCGSGTVLVEAQGLGRTAVGVDASPLGVAIAETRSAVLGEAGRAELVAEAGRIAEESGASARRRRRPPVPPWARREIERFHPHVLLELLGLRALVLATRSDTPLGRALRMCLSSILVKFMKAGPEAPRDGAAKRIGRGVPSRMFGDRAVELAEGLAALERRTPAGTRAPQVRLGDARALTFLAAGSVRLVLSSPPYAGTYDYAAQHEVRFTWLELPRRSFEEAQVGARERGHLGTDPARWREGRRRWLVEMGRVLASDGRVLLVAGDGVVGDQPEDTPAAIAAAAAGTGLEPVARASQVRPTRDQRLRTLFGNEPRREHLLLLRKR